MLKMITFILCVFYDNFFNEVKKEKAQTLDTQWLRGRLQRLDAQAQRTSGGAHSGGHARVSPGQPVTGHPTTWGPGD